MRFKSKYNVGDVVMFYNHRIHDNDIGKIGSIKISFSLETLHKESYRIYPVRIEEDYSDNGIEIEVNSIRMQLNKKAFEKAFAEKCARYVSNQHEDKGE